MSQRAAPSALEILYSTDYPYEAMVSARSGSKSVEIALEDQIKIGRLNTTELSLAA
jgi:hypothetical protein